MWTGNPGNFNKSLNSWAFLARGKVCLTPFPSVLGGSAGTPSYLLWLLFCVSSGFSLLVCLCKSSLI